MQFIHQYLATSDLWALAFCAVMIAIFTANSSYQKHRSPACERITQRAERETARDRSGPPRAHTQPASTT